ncbi:unnamed protein product [Mytilus coruscus]|uniref:Uncharacterized protein n=1 Tax=Mytilus coruscus TaxID=42192 RepID=A0A6J8D671_MYTCO|nr:unnamed protein product [Mytilus coruscus]
MIGTVGVDKSVTILPVRTTSKTIETGEGFWIMDDKPMPVVKTATHIGIHKSEKIHPEILSQCHFLLTCESLETDRERLMEIIVDRGSELLAKSCFEEEIDLVQLIVNPFYYTIDKRNNDLNQSIAGQLEVVCRQLINNLHLKRYELLIKQQKCDKKNNIS